MFQISKDAASLKDQINKTPQLILIIEGIPFKFSTDTVLVNAFFDQDFLFDDVLFFDTPVRDETSRDFVSFEGTTNTLAQQLILDKGGAGSIQSFTINLVNRNSELDEYFKSGNFVPDLLGAQAQVFSGFKGGAFPNDYVLLFSGFIDSFQVKHGAYLLNVAHPDQLKRQEILNPAYSELTAPITNVQTTITVGSTEGFLIPTPEQEQNFLAYIQIDDEIIKLTPSIASTEFQNVLRNQLRTAAAAHDDEAEVKSFYRIIGKPIDLYLKLMLSGSGIYKSGVASDRFVSYDGVKTISNAVFFQEDIFFLYNIQEGDFITISGSQDNDHVDALILDTGFVDGFYYVIVDQVLISESDSSALCSFKSQFDTMPVGLGMKPNQIDIDGIKELETLIGSSLPDVDIFIRDEINVKEWTEKELFKPLGLYAVPKKGRSSIGATLPPLNSGQTILVNQDTIINMTQLSVRRSTQKNLYNTIVYKFEEKSIDSGKYRAGLIISSEDSFNRIKTGNKQLIIEANSLRDNTVTRSLIRRQAERLLDKYKFAPQYIEGIQLLYKDGYQLEVGDVVVFGGNETKIPNTETGEPLFRETLMEVINKKVDLKAGRVTLDLINSAFEINGRFVVFSPASKIIGQSAPNAVVLEQSFAYDPSKDEFEKWLEFKGKLVRIRNEDFSQVQILKIAQYNFSSNNEIVFNEPITITLDETSILDCPDYDDASDYQKISYGSMNPQDEVLDIISADEIEVADGSLYFEGSIVTIHSNDYAFQSDEIEVVSIIGNIIEFNQNHGASIGHKIDLIGFSQDDGLPYRYI
jgi:hypothetical protein